MSVRVFLTGFVAVATIVFVTANIAYDIGHAYGGLDVRCANLARDYPASIIADPSVCGEKWANEARETIDRKRVEECLRSEEPRR